jgi:hypothetical protein
LLHDILAVQKGTTVIEDHPVIAERFIAIFVFLIRVHIKGLCTLLSQAIFKFTLLVHYVDGTFASLLHLECAIVDVEVLMVWDRCV